MIRIHLLEDVPIDNLSRSKKKRKLVNKQTFVLSLSTVDREEERLKREKEAEERRRRVEEEERERQRQREDEERERQRQIEEEEEEERKRSHKLAEKEREELERYVMTVSLMHSFHWIFRKDFSGDSSVSLSLVQTSRRSLQNRSGGLQQ